MTLGETPIPHLIGRYQLENLVKNKIGFLFIDLGVVSRDHPMMNGSVSLAVSEVLSYLEKEALPLFAPIVLICENGGNSLSVARTLGDKAYINVFVIEGGRSALMD